MLTRAMYSIGKEKREREERERENHSYIPVGADIHLSASDVIERSDTTCNFTYRTSDVQPYKAFEHFNAHIKTAQQRTITQQYGDWYTGR